MGNFIHNGELEALENDLNSFDPEVRKNVLNSLITRSRQERVISDNVNLHLHSFYSYNAENWSPSRIAWECAKKGLFAAGIVDFDVIDGQQEFIRAGELLKLRTSIGLETRSFMTEYADKEIDSPGEPGVSYILAGGFMSEIPTGSPQAVFLQYLRSNSESRNLALIDRINAHVPDIAIDYPTHVLPLTPSGNATERHIIKAYILQSEYVFKDAEKCVKFWQELLERSTDEVKKLFQNRASLEELVRSKLAKRGGVGYIQPGPDTFPKTEEFFAWAKQCDAIPMDSWLDGSSEGESDGKALLECSRSKGAQALNLIPDRNWNISDPALKKAKTSRLAEIIEIAESMHMPLHIGTEMNKAGLPFVDDLNGPVLRSYKDIFIKGAQVFAGHSILSRFAKFSYAGEKSSNTFGDDILSKNHFFSSVGALPPLDAILTEKLAAMDYEKAFGCIQDAVQVGKW
jgi:hypothetical protein